MCSPGKRRPLSPGWPSFGPPLWGRVDVTADAFSNEDQSSGAGNGASRSCIRPTGFKHSHYGEPTPPSPRSASCHRGWSRGFDGEPVLEGGGGGRPEPVPTVRVISVCVGQQKRAPLVPRSASGALTGRARAADACGGAGAGRERAGAPPSGGLPRDGRPPSRQRTETVPRFRSSRRAHE